MRFWGRSRRPLAENCLIIRSPTGMSREIGVSRMVSVVYCVRTRQSEVSFAGKRSAQKAEVILSEIDILQ